MRKLILAALLVALLLPVRVQAQSAIQLDSTVVQLWPEFDKPQMLVMYEFTLSASTALPQDISFRIPASATVSAVAVGETHDAVTDEGIVYDTNKQGNWLVVTIKDVAAPAVRLEFYDALQIDGAARHYVYTWPGDYATGGLLIVFQQPVDATDLFLNPAASSNQTDNNGLVYYQVNFPALAAGEAATLTADYQKTTDRLSSSLPQVESSVPLDNNAQGRISLTNYLPWVVGGAGFLLIVIGLIVGLNYFRSTGKGSVARKRHVARREEGETDQAYYCPQCGKRAQPADQFCRTCGTRLRRED
jgi:predicted RNA-binding Zn-ribbon protein involved in translation (DUF1610 family)